MELESNLKQYEKITSLKAFLVDGSSRILFYTLPIGLWEMFGAGMENIEVLRSRGTSVLVNLFAGRIHGKTREILSYWTSTTEKSSRKRKFLVEATAGLIVGGGTYAAVLFLVSGASHEEAQMALPFGLLYNTLSGRPCGWFMDKYRKFWNTTPVYEKNIF